MSTPTDPILQELSTLNEGLDSLAEVPLAETIDSFSDVHVRLQAALADLDRV